MNKFTKKALSVSVAALLSVTTIFSGNQISAKAAETKNTVDATQTATDEQTSTTRVHFTPPNSAEDLAKWSTANSHLYVYAYYMEDENTSVDLLGKWPGNQMEEKGTDGYYSYDVPNAPDGKTTEVIFSCVEDSTGNVIVQLPGEKKGGLELPKDKERWYEGGTLKREESTTPTNTPAVATTPAVTATSSAVATTTAPTPTATVAPTAVPTVEPVNGPQAIVSVPNGTSYFEEDYDTLTVKVSPANGATSCTYSVDNGPAKTITEATDIKIGEGKIANSPITLKITSTDGTTANTQTFTYFKATKVGTYTSVSLKSSLTKLFGIVKTTAEAQATTLHVSFKIPANDNSEDKDLKRSNWKGDDIHVYAYAYYDTPETAADPDKLPNYPLGDFPGTEMKSEGTDTYSIDVSTTTGEAKIIFIAVKGKVAPESTVYVDEKGNAGLPYRECKQLAKLPNLDGYTIKGTTGTKISFDAAAMPTVEPTSTAPTATPTTVPTATPPESQKPATTAPVTQDPTTTAPVTQEPTPTPVVKMDAYFGASLSAPQLNTTKQKLSAVVVNPQGSVNYTFAVDGTIIYNGANATIDWDTEGLSAGMHILTVSITDGKSLKSIRKTYTIETAAPEVTATATAPVTSATPDVTTTPAIATTAPAIATTAPAIATTAPAITVTTAPAVTATPTVVPTATATAPAVTTTPAVTATPKVSASVSIRSGKTAGETIPVTLRFTKAKNDKTNYVYTYSVTKSKKTKTLASKTTKKTVKWTPSTNGTYTVKVKLINKANGKVVKTVSKNYKVLKRVITIKKVTISKKTNKKKVATITITAKAVTTKGKVSYRIVVRNNKGKTVASKKYAKKSKLVWKTKKKGTYKITISVKNGKGVEVSKTKTYKVK